mgnify:CR=1 FL=1
MVKQIDTPSAFLTLSQVAEAEQVFFKVRVFCTMQELPQAIKSIAVIYALVQMALYVRIVHVQKNMNRFSCRKPLASPLCQVVSALGNLKSASLDINFKHLFPSQKISWHTRSNPAPRTMPHIVNAV